MAPTRSSDQHRRSSPERSGVGLVLAATLTWLLAACTGDGSPPEQASPEGRPEASPNASSPAESPGPEFTAFTDVSGETGIDFDRDNGFDGRNWRIVETVNGGVALLDHDGDGRIDIYFTSGRRIDPGADPPRNALFRNLGGWRFEDVSRRSATDDAALSMGCTVADFDGDSRSDLYVTNLGPNRLYRNLGDGRFEDVAAAAGVAQESMDAGCAFFDMDGDGDLDLYVASYVIDEKKGQSPAVVHGAASYWPPQNYRPAPDHLYRNRGDGTFEDVTSESGIGDVSPGRGLGVLATDLDGDGDTDLYVANDMSPNFMFLNDGRGRFSEEAYFNGTALGRDGEVQGSMGIDAADYDGDGHTDLVVTNYQGQLNNLFRASGAGEYVDMVDIAGIGAGSLREVAWGVGFADLDCDGREDLFVGNGHLNPNARAMSDATRYEQSNRVFRNLGDGRFREFSEACGEALLARQVSRGVALGDLDGDGDLDVVVVNSRGRPQILRNDSDPSRSRVLVRLVGAGRNTEAIGARVEIRAGGRRQWRERRSAGSYLSVNDPRLHFGLGPGEGTIERLDVRWPDGRRQTFTSVPANRELTIRQGSDTVETRELEAREAPGSGSRRE